MTNPKADQPYRFRAEAMRVSFGASKFIPAKPTRLMLRFIAEEDSRRQLRLTFHSTETYNVGEISR